MKFDDIFQRFTEKSPVAVSVHILLERVFSPDKLNQWFEKTAVNQYTRELSFSSIFELMNGVVFKMFPCVFNIRVRTRRWVFRSRQSTTS